MATRKARATTPGTPYMMTLTADELAKRRRMAAYDKKRDAGITYANKEAKMEQYKQKRRERYARISAYNRLHAPNLIASRLRKSNARSIIKYWSDAAYRKGN